jgi:hypothetical protein
MRDPNSISNKAEMCCCWPGPGANVAGSIYQPHITSYDYDCPVSEAGGVGQPGIGGDDKFEVFPPSPLHQSLVSCGGAAAATPA